MSTPYSSIETLYKRDKATNKLDFTKIRQPEWKHIAGWALTEKIDGTNIRVTVDLNGITVKGRSDNAQIPSGLEQYIRSIFKHEAIIAHFTNSDSAYKGDDFSVTFYGEGYGPGITGSEKMTYRKPEMGKGFRCFDLKFGENVWASVDEWSDICAKLDIPQVHVLGFQTVLPEDREGAEYMMTAFCEHSPVASMEAGVIIHAEGLVARPMQPLFNRYRERVIWKLCMREFR